MRRGQIMGSMLLFLLVLFPGYSFAADLFEQYLTEVTLVVQRDARYASEMYRYYKKAFHERGCGPAAVTNAISVACGIQEQSMTDAILRDVMRQMTYNHTPSETAISADCIDNLMELNENSVPVLCLLSDRYGEYWYATDEVVTWETMSPFLTSALDAKQPAFFAGCFAVRGHWGELAAMLREMNELGMGDAIVCLTMLSSGTEATGAPFRLSDGHYETIAFKVSEFARYGSMYLIDSAPRALPWEELKRGTYYSTYSLDMDGEMLTDTFAVTRLTPSVIRLRLLEEVQVSLRENPAESDQPEQEAYAEAEAAMLEKLLFYGTGNIIVTLP